MIAAAEQRRKNETVFLINPHSFRNTLARIGQERCQSAEELKAWSQNLGHEQMMTTLTSYGRIDEHRQGEIIKGLGRVHASPEEIRDLVDRLAVATRRQA